MITNKIQKAIENKHYLCGIFLDLSKAFDTVNHYILLRKLENYGIRGVANEWFSSYLQNRQQYVTNGNTNSEQRMITCGVPQGSVLGPLLFLLYINDFKNCASGIDFHLFADDSNLLCTHKNLECLEVNLNIQLNRVNEWLCANELSLKLKNPILFFSIHPKRKQISQ